jgi:Methylpurine-DNA glycosylase (MPG)
MVARELLGKVLMRRVDGNQQALEITETEAYLGPYDLASHSARGRTPRTEVMFGPLGRLYIYLVYGLHLMLNVVTGPRGSGSAVLIRAAGNAQGPGVLGRELSLTTDLNGEAASRQTGLWFRRASAGAPHHSRPAHWGRLCRPDMVASETALYPAAVVHPAPIVPPPFVEKRNQEQDERRETARRAVYFWF